MRVLIQYIFILRAIKRSLQFSRRIFRLLIRYMNERWKCINITKLLLNLAYVMNKPHKFELLRTKLFQPNIEAVKKHLDISNETRQDANSTYPDVQFNI